jgi:hypothetical protein
MVRPPLTEQHLKRELAYFREKFSNLQDDELFVVWFLRAFVTEDEESAAKSLTGGGGDKGIDAVLIDDAAKIVFVVQGKYRQKFNQKNEWRNDVLGFANLAHELSDKEAFASLIEGMQPLARKRATEAYERCTKRKYKLKLYFLSSGKTSGSLRDEANRLVRRSNERASLDIFDGRQILLLLRDYLDGVAPPVPSLELEMEATDGVRVNGILQRYDTKTNIEAWVFSMSGLAVGELYNVGGSRLFARNVRGFLGSTEVNKNMEATLDHQAQHFWYYNNGITIVCDDAEHARSSGKDILRVKNPQIINGQQTTRTLHRYGARAARASVVVRVIRVPRHQDGRSDNFESLVSQIVGATNFQNKIGAADLMSNDRQQIEIERQLRKFNYWYIRKRQTKSEARRESGVRHYVMIKKEDLAQAVAACELDPAVLRTEGREGLFEERFYQQVFPTGAPHFYLSRYLLMRATSYMSAGYPYRAYAKWLVLHFMWGHLSPLVRTRNGAECFRTECERRGPSDKHLLRCIDIAFNASLKFYRAKRGTGAKALDVSSFFRRRGLDDDFEKFWISSTNNRRGTFRRAWQKYETVFRQQIER